MPMPSGVLANGVGGMIVSGCFGATGVVSGGIMLSGAPIAVLDADQIADVIDSIACVLLRIVEISTK